MRLVAKFSVKNGEKSIKESFAAELDEVYDVITRVDASKCKTKKSEEKTMPGQLLYSPSAMNKLFKHEFAEKIWKKAKVPCQYSTENFLEGYTPTQLKRGAYREMDFVKNGLGIEVQFGKYAFMVYNVCAKMTIFRNLHKITAGIEIVPVKALQSQMSTGVSYFEQFAWDLQKRGEADIDIPVLILGIDV
jgi:hypothetical protein